MQVSEELKQLYRDDWLPKRDTVLEKQLFLYFPDLNLTFSEDDGVQMNSFKLTESICEEKELVFGGCCSSELKVSLYDVVQELTGQKVIVWQIVDNVHRMDLGTFYVDSAKKKASNPLWKEIIAYDETKYKLDKDCAEFYNNFFSDNLPHTLKEFRIALFKYCNVNILEQELINDHIKIEKTSDLKNVTGRFLARSIGEINGMFGSMNRDNVFSYISLENPSLYPSETLYPSEYIYPTMANEVFTENEVPYYAKKSKYSEFEVKPIDSVQIRQEEGDIGSVSGQGNNAYIVTGNIFCFGKNAEELKVVSDNLLLNIQGIAYKPHTTKMIGLPYVKPGARYVILTENDTIETYVFKRILSNPQAWNDEISAQGNEKRVNEVSQNQEIIQLQGKYFKILKDVDGLELEVGDLQKGYSKIIADVDSINLEVRDLKDSYTSITQTINSINLEVGKKVNSDSIISAINLSTEGVKIEASKINITGLVTFDDLKNSGSTIINGDNITTGTINANLVKVENIDINQIMHQGKYRLISASDEKMYIGANKYTEYIPSDIEMAGLKVDIRSGFSNMTITDDIKISSHSNLTVNSNGDIDIYGRVLTILARNSILIQGTVVDIYHLKASSSVGFFGKSPTGQRLVSRLPSGTTDIYSVASKLDELIHALNIYGLV